MNNKPYIAYVRISTKYQEGNHSFDSQLSDINRMMGYKPVRVFKEVASGRKDDRTKVNEALDYCKANDTIFVSAYVDRFARSVALLTKVLGDKIKLKFCDFPEASDMILTIVMAVAKAQADQTSVKVKAGMAVARAKGKQIGSPKNLTPEARAKGRKARQRKSLLENSEHGNLIVKLVDSGSNINQVTKWLQENGYKTINGKEYNHTQVSNLYYRYKKRLTEISKKLKGVRDASN